MNPKDGLLLEADGLLAECETTIRALLRIVKWACDTEDLDFFIRDNPTDVEATALLREIVL